MNFDINESKIVRMRNTEWQESTQIGKLVTISWLHKYLCI